VNVLRNRKRQVVSLAYVVSIALIVMTAYLLIAQPAGSTQRGAFHCDERGKAVEIPGIDSEEEFKEWIAQNQRTLPPPSEGPSRLPPVAERDPECRPSGVHR
jgi:hypothetical protein